MLLCVGLEVLIVCRDDPKGSLIIEAVQECLCDGSAYRRLCAPPDEMLTSTEEYLYLSHY